MRLRRLLAETAEMLAPVSGEDAACDARELVSFVLGKKAGLSDAEVGLSSEMRERLDALIQRRLAHEPLQYIIGEWDLMGLTFRVDPSVLIPRADTETVVLAAEELIKERAYRSLLDLCTGSGCIGISLAVRTGIKTVLADISEEALAVARDNAAAHGADCETVKSDMFAALNGRRFDIITCNPPYVPAAVIETLAEEVRREPRLALDGGEDGLRFYRALAEKAPFSLNPGGALVMEIGFDQAESVKALFGPLGEVNIIKDLSGNFRAAVLTGPKIREYDDHS